MSSKMTFESAMQKLEDEVKRLESGSITLDESLKSFETAVKLLKICNEKLENAERRVRILVSADDGTITDAPFDQITDET